MTLTDTELSSLAERLQERHRIVLAVVREEIEQSDAREYGKLIGALPGDVGDQSVADTLADLNISIADRHITHNCAPSRLRCCASGTEPTGRASIAARKSASSGCPPIRLPSAAFRTRIASKGHTRTKARRRSEVADGHGAISDCTHSRNAGITCRSNHG